MGGVDPDEVEGADEVEEPATAELPEAALPELDAAPPVATPLADAATDPSTFTPLDVNALRINTSPLICADCSSDRLISRLSMLPFVDLITAGGCCWSAGGSDAEGTGTIPSAASIGSELTGSCTGIAALLITDR